MKCYKIFLLFLLQLIFLRLHRSRAANVDIDSDNLSIDVVNSGRCVVRCLSLLQTRMGTDASRKLVGGDDDDDDEEDDDEDDGGGDVDDDDVEDEDRIVTMQACKADDSCSKCIRPCDNPLLVQDRCQDVCIGEENTQKFDEGRTTGTGVCSESCRFLQQVNSIRPGTCPPENQATGSAAVCRKNCNSDADCSRPDFKCCSNGCGWTCQLPSHAHDGMPDVLEAPLVTPIATHLDSPSSHLDSVMLRWKPQPANVTGTVLYVIDYRSYEEGSSRDLTKMEWNQILKTTFPSTRVNELKPGHIYQFRASAINIYGNRKPSSPSLPYAAFKEPERPGPPQNLTEGNSLIKDGRVTVTIKWMAPLVSSLPIYRYKIHWSKRVKSGANHATQDFKQVVTGDQTHYEIENLDPDTSYYVQVQAISLFREVRLKSDKTGITITTYKLPRHSDNVFQSWTTYSPVLPTPTTPEDLVAKRPYFQNGLLKANVSWTFDEDSLSAQERVFKVQIYWSPEGCASVDVRQDESLPPVMSATAHENAYVIYDLQFGCRYLIRVQGISEEGTVGKMGFTFLDTPFCNNVLVVGGVKPDCPRNLPRVPDQPINIQHKFQTAVSSITAKLSWSPPPQSYDVAITGYLVVWSHVLSDNQALLVNKTSVVARLVSKDVQTLVIGSFDEDTIYSIRIQANSKSGWGRVASLRINTPSLLSGSYRNPVYKDLGAVDFSQSLQPESPSRQNSVRNRYVSAINTRPPPVVNLDSARTPQASRRPFIYKNLQVADIQLSPTLSSSSSSASSLSSSSSSSLSSMPHLSFYTLHLVVFVAEVAYISLTSRSNLFHTVEHLGVSLGSTFACMLTRFFEFSAVLPFSFLFILSASPHWNPFVCT